MKRVIGMLVVLCLLLQVSLYAGATESVFTERKKVNYSGGSKDITVVWVNMNDPKVRLDTVLADGTVGNTATLKEIVESSHDVDGRGIAGVNGSFFAAYSDFQPLGTLIMDGQVEHISNTGSVISVDQSNAFSVDPLYVAIAGATREQWSWPYNWYAWNINHYYTDATAVMLFNSHYEGPKPAHSFTSIVVDKSVVKSVTTGSFEIPEEGFLILTNNADIIGKFELGKQADYDMNYFVNDYTTTNHTGVAIDYAGVRTAIGAGPTLVKAGKIVLDGASEGFTENKILTEAAQRSLVGVRADGYVGFASVSGVTMTQLAEIALELKMVEAMNLDGGASSGTYYNGSYLTVPGRELSNALVVRYLYEDPIGIELNGAPLFFDTEPYANLEYKRTLVPLRGIAEAIGATVGWDGDTASIVITRGEIELKLKTDSKIVYVSGVKKEMELPLVIRDQRSYVPTRFFTEYFGGTATWRGEDRTVVITIDTVDQLMVQGKADFDNKNYVAAIEVYKNILKIDSDHIYAVKQLASLNDTYVKDKEEAIKYYEMAMEIEPTDDATLNALAWLYYGENQIDNGIVAFTKLSKISSREAGGYYGLGLCYASWDNDKNANKDVVAAKKYFQLAIDNGLTGAMLTFAEDYIKRN